MDPRLFLFAFLLAGCGSDEDAPKVARGDYLKAVSGPLCERFKECAPNSFAKSYDGGVPHCTTDLQKTSSPDERTKCSQAQVDTCVADVKKTDCNSVGFDPTQAAPSCRTCF
jgi:hypothetical protein